jgi:hypothetical protein
VKHGQLRVGLFEQGDRFAVDSVRTQVEDGFDEQVQIRGLEPGRAGTCKIQEAGKQTIQPLAL